MSDARTAARDRLAILWLRQQGLSASIAEDVMANDEIFLKKQALNVADFAIMVGEVAFAINSGISVETPDAQA